MVALPGKGLLALPEFHDEVRSLSHVHAVAASPLPTNLASSAVAVRRDVLLRCWSLP